MGQWGGDLDRQALLLKLSAGFSLAAASPSLAPNAKGDGQPPTMAVDGEYSGVWESSYRFTSSGRGSQMTGRHYLIVRQRGNLLTGRSVPASNGSLLSIELEVAGTVATGTWSERTSLTGYYRGAVYHGALQLVIDPMGKSMQGRWVGFDRGFEVASDRWELRWVAESTRHSSVRPFHFKA